MITALFRIRHDHPRAAGRWGETPRGRLRVAARHARLAVLVLLALLACGTAGCGGTDDLRERGEKLRDQGQQLRDRAQATRDRAERSARRLADRCGRPSTTFRRPRPRAMRRRRRRAAHGGGRVAAFLTDVLRSVDSYWTRTLTASDLPEPRVALLWIAPGRGRAHRLGIAGADDNAAFYCSATTPSTSGGARRRHLADGASATSPASARATAGRWETSG